MYKYHGDNLTQVSADHLVTTAPKYKVSVITVDKLKQYHVVNLETNVTQSLWSDLQTALVVMRDLNRMAKRKIA